MRVPVVVVVVVVVEGSRQYVFWVVEIVLSTPNKICALWLKYLVFVTFGIFAFLLLYSTTAVCVHFHFWQKIKSKTKNLFLLLFHSTTAAVRTQGWDGRTHGQTGQNDTTVGPGSQ